MTFAEKFALVGILVGLSGFNIQPLFQNPWVLTAFALLFVLLALSMFGLFQLQMPNTIQAKVSEISNKQQSGSFTGVAVMGTARGIYTFFGHLKWSWAILLGYLASIGTHFLVNASLFT